LRKLERVATLQESNWKIKFSWVKVHAGIHGNEKADKLAKEAARSRLIDITYSRIPMSSTHHDIQLDSIKMAKGMANMHQGTDDESVLPVCRGKVKEKD
jgi:hypothetical protein